LADRRVINKPTPAIATRHWYGDQLRPWLCLSVCVRALKRKRLELPTPKSVQTFSSLHDSRSTCIDPEVKKSEVKVTRLYEVCCGVSMRVDTTAWVFYSSSNCIALCRFSRNSDWYAC